ncbi:hypothetical protein [Streptomyces sp. NPDC001274]
MTEDVRSMPPQVGDERASLSARHNGQADLLRERLDGVTGE